MSTPRMVIAGAHGFVGSRLAQQYPQALIPDSALLRNPEAGLREFLLDCQPEIIWNAAAISDIGACAADPEGSYRANVLLPVALAEAAEAVGGRLISFSSDQVYTCCREAGPFREDLELPEPANLYARHKLEAERRVLECHPGAVLLRATWMYDLPQYGQRSRGNFLVNTLNALLRGMPVRVPCRQHRGITYVRQVVERMDRLPELPGGVYNFGSENPLTMRETAQALLEVLGAEAEVEDTGMRPPELWMDCGKIKAHGIFFDTTAQGFARCAADYGLR